MLWFNYGQKKTFFHSCDDLPCGGMVWGVGRRVAPKNIFKKQKCLCPQKLFSKNKKGHLLLIDRKSEGQTPLGVGLAQGNRTNGS